MSLTGPCLVCGEPITTEDAAPILICPQCSAGKSLADKPVLPQNQCPGTMDCFRSPGEQLGNNVTEK